ncbi:hypothetical protein DFE_3255 [Desulfovibrio ferrophilus]|uniref:Uncharacterized protein n=1 Tax=Desulfovibrio ferrophilus TaxID=241368 RepID=A0A2Z6B3B3_9BACT|nr:hypothetical protein DFE_3255 [Desulfovibrio ferrophilus]
MPGQEANAWLTALMAVAGVTAPIKAFLPPAEHLTDTLITVVATFILHCR